MYQNIKSPMPSKIRVVSFSAFISLLLSFVIFSVGLYLYLLKDLEEKTLAAESILTDKMNTILVELKGVAQNATLSCEKADVRNLIEKSFYSPMFKEYGLFNEDYRVYCSNFGPQTFTIYSSISKRIKESKDGITVSLVQSNTLGHQTFFAFYQGENGIGVNGLAPPKSLVVELEQLLSSQYPYSLTVGKRIFSSQEANPDFSVLSQRTVALDQWTMSLVVSLPSYLYWDYFCQSMPLFAVLWFLLFASCCAIYWTILYYRYSLSHSLKKAIKEEAMDVYFQPIISLNDQKARDMEALIRWKSPYHGQVSPLTIIEMADRLGVIDNLTWMVIRKVGRFYRENSATLADVSIAVNVDRHSLLKESFIPNLQRILAEYPELKGRLGLEVTETSALNMSELPIMVSQFERIKALGIELSVDDFGTGYSGLDFLRRFPYDVLKLDRVFVSSFQDDQFTRQILTSVTKLARELNMRVVAEGIEEQEQLDAITELGVDSVQGYFFSVPLPGDQIIQWLKEKTQK
ncbi:EAL domain-containing protein [Marinomonas sp. 2405UD66-6]|uniref:EAL domain-containing protein n=1 Tax=Marinomonas sp. 2405UD66-6 TaxID=3391834 RepID=UPI0039C98EB6